MIAARGSQGRGRALGNKKLQNADNNNSPTANVTGLAPHTATRIHKVDDGIKVDWHGHGVLALTHPFIHSFTHSFTHSLLHSLTSLVLSLTRSLTQTLTHALTHSTTPSLT